MTPEEITRDKFDEYLEVCGHPMLTGQVRPWEPDDSSMEIGGSCAPDAAAEVMPKRRAA